MIFLPEDMKGVFTPPSFEGTLIAPSNIGGIQWGGMSYDVDRDILITNINHIAHLVQLFPRHDPQKWSAYLQEVRNDDNGVDPETNRMLGTPYYMSRMIYAMATKAGAWFMTRPPWGTIVGINMKTGDKIWEKPLGFMSEQAPFKDFGAPNMGGTCLTASGLTFIAGTPDNHLRAFDTKNGELLWEHPLPASGIATPMSYVVDGKQYIVIAAGGHGKNPFTKKGDYVVVFSL